MGPADDWTTWFDRHADVLVLFARQIVGSSQDAEDAVQDGFVRFWRRRDQADDPAAYLFACVRTSAVDLVRTQARRRHRQRKAASEPRSSFEPNTDRLGLDEAVETALGRLPVEQREVVVMKIWGGLTFARIAAALELSPDTVASRYRYAIGKLRNELDGIRSDEQA